MILGIEGLLAGAAHVVSGPDHLAGVAPLAAGKPGGGQGARIGFQWGVGHGLGVALLGILGQTVLAATGMEVASSWAERLVGALLIVLGALAIHRSRTLVIHEHRHSHGEDGEHVHVHLHGTDHDHGRDPHGARADGHGHRHAALGVGLVHGLAGAGHLWAVLPSLAMGRADAAVYLAGYLLASVAVMTLFGATLGRMAARLGQAGLRRFIAAVGAVTILIGAAWLVMTLG